MRILSIETKGIRGLKDASISFEGPQRGQPHSVALVTGKPSSGKTSLLRAIAAAKASVGSFGVPPVSASVLDHGVAVGRLEAKWCLTEGEQRAANRDGPICRTMWNAGNEVAAQVDAALRFVFAGHGGPEPKSKLEWVPASRPLAVDRFATLTGAPSSGAEMVKRARDEPDKYDSLLRAMHDAVAGEADSVVRMLSDKGIALRSQVPDALAAARGNVAAMCQDVRLVAVEPRGDLRPLLWFQSRSGKRIEMAELSHSEHQGLLFALLFATIELRESIVLIDTPELHIHPADHVRFFRAICDLGASSQIIAATTSPDILGSVAPDQIIDLSKPMESGA